MLSYAGIHDIGYEVEIVMEVHPTKVDIWATALMAVVHEEAEHHFTSLGSKPFALLRLSFDDKAWQRHGTISRNLDVVTLSHPSAIQNTSTDFLEGQLKTLKSNPFQDAARVGTHKRGKHKMVSHGFNFTGSSRGLVNVYNRSDVSLETITSQWAKYTALSNLVCGCIQQTMGSYPQHVMCSAIRDHLFQPDTSRAVKHSKRPSKRPCRGQAEEPAVIQADEQIPVLRGVPCTAIHQTLNAMVEPHFDSNDASYTLIAWMQRGAVVGGPFVLHQFGYFLPLQVRASTSMHCGCRVCISTCAVAFRIHAST